VWVVEVGEGGSTFNATQLAVVDVGEGWRHVELSYTPRDHAKYLQFQIRYNTSGNDPALWIKDVEVVAYAPLRVYSIWIYPAKAGNTVKELLAATRPSAEVVEVRRIDPTRWAIKATSEGPFMLVLAESFDPNWEARVYKDGRLTRTVRPVLANGVAMGFQVDGAGEMILEIRYAPQRLYELGIAISATTFLALAAYSAWNWLRNRRK